MAFSQPQPLLLAGNPVLTSFENGVHEAIENGYNYETPGISPWDIYGIAYSSYPYGMYPSYVINQPSLEGVSNNSSPLCSPVYASVVKYHPAVPYLHQPLLPGGQTDLRVHELEQQVWTQAQVIQTQQSMLAMAYDPRAFYGNPPLLPPHIVQATRETSARLRPRKITSASSNETRGGKPDAPISEKRAQAKQYKTFVRTHYTVRGAFRLIAHFLAGEEKEKFLSDTRPYLRQFAAELKSSVPGALTNQSLARPDQAVEFGELSLRHVRSVIQSIKRHSQFVDSQQNEEHEAVITSCFTEPQEGRVGFSRLVIFAITALGVTGKTRLNQIATMLENLGADMSEDPELIPNIKEEAKARAQNFQLFCSKAAIKVNADYPVPSLDSSNTSNSNVANQLSDIDSIKDISHAVGNLSVDNPQDVHNNSEPCERRKLQNEVVKFNVDEEKQDMCDKLNSTCTKSILVQKAVRVANKSSNNNKHAAPLPQSSLCEGDKRKQACEAEKQLQNGVKTSRISSRARPKCRV